MIKIREITESSKKSFNKVVSHPLQSWVWGEFRKKTGNQTVRFGVFQGKQLLEGYQLTIHPVPYTKFKLATFLKGPQPSEAMLEFLKNWGKKENILFIRIEPNTPASSKLEKMLLKYGAKPGRPSFTKSTFWIDLTKSEEELLKSMHPKTRYNIKLAQRHGVRVSEDNSSVAFQKYLELMDETTKRQGFYAHTASYHNLMWEMLKKEGIANLLVARYKKKILITWILLRWHDFLYYPYGASSEENREVMASSLVMWEAIRLGKKLGLKTFDLWGREEGKGFTKFKEGFNPQVIEFLGTWDLIINPFYYHIYSIAEKIRWTILKTKAKILPTSSFK